MERVPPATMRGKIAVALQVKPLIFLQGVADVDEMFTISSIDLLRARSCFERKRKVAWG
jgi:hypothetical protein